jgi:hypothetical protein
MDSSVWGLVPAMAWPTVRATVPRAVRGANQSSNRQDLWMKIF